MQRSPVPRKRLTPRERSRILEAYQHSSLPRKQFAARAGISVSALQNWLRKPRPAIPAVHPVEFIEVPAAQIKPVLPAIYRLQIPGGLILEIPPGFRSEEVTQLLRLLQTL